MAKASKYLFHAQSCADSVEEGDALMSAMDTALDCEAVGHPYPDEVRAATVRAYALLQEAAPEVSAELGPPFP